MLPLAARPGGGVGLEAVHNERFVAEVPSRLAVRERELHQLVGANLETMLGVRPLAGEYSTGPVHGGRIDTLGIDESGAPVVVEYKRGVDAGVINQGLYYLSWLVDHKVESKRWSAAVSAQPRRARCCGAHPG